MAKHTVLNQFKKSKDGDYEEFALDALALIRARKIMEELLKEEGLI